jgi:hypothetical protein
MWIRIYNIALNTSITEELIDLERWEGMNMSEPDLE